MPLIRIRADIDDLLGGPTPAEQKLLAACAAGLQCHLGRLPGAHDTTREVRADVLRYLILGGCKDCPVNGWGVRLSGAYISGGLDISFENARKATGLMRCRFAENLLARQSKFNMLVLNGSALKGVNIQGIKVLGGVFLRGITTTGNVSLSGAEIGGSLDCHGATFSAAKGAALNAQRIEVTGGAFLRQVTATGTVSLSSAKISGSLSCEGASFTATTRVALNAQGINVIGGAFLNRVTASGTVKLSGAEIGGSLECPGATFSATEGAALTLQGARIRRGLIWQNITFSSGALVFNAAHVGNLVDDLTSWPEAGRLILDGFTYDRISAAPTDAARRLDWLAKGSTWKGEFFPQPYTQLAKVLREMGHDGEARKVLARRERLIRYHIREDARIMPNGDVGVALHSLWRDIINLLRWGFDLLLRWVVGYGHKPFLSLAFLLALIAITVFPAHFAWEEGSFAPNSGPVLVSEDWQSYHTTEANPAQVWSGELAPRGWAATADCRHWKDCAPGRDWETFNRYAYAVDVVIPIIDIGQTDAWAPSTTRGWWGQQLWWFKGVLSVFGWIVTALGAAAITGIIRRD